MRVHGHHFAPECILLRGDLGESLGLLLGDLGERALESRPSRSQQPREGHIEAGADVRLKGSQDWIEQHGGDL
jgi:hypothetical protein